MVKEKLVFVFFIIDNMVNPAGVERTAAADDTVDFKRADKGMYIADWDGVKGGRLKQAVSRDHGIERDQIEMDRH